MKARTKKIFDSLFENYSVLLCLKNEIRSAYEIIRECYANKKKTLICGNGGSASDSEHIVGELMKGFMLKRPVEINGIQSKLQGALRSVSLVSQTSLITAVANDIGADMIFAQQVYGYMDEGDVLIAISTSGNAENVVNAAVTAKAMNGKIIALTGKTGGKLKDICDAAITLPFCETYRIQEYTLPVYHAVCAMIESEFFDL
ncbi:MAG: SIS domain-containing protein [Oscillospiraceae bacterium]|nr:SIS domain-containing protein [Oscillospiraceae bacterium]